jgi:SAM-dependent methyltransferase
MNWITEWKKIQEQSVLYRAVRQDGEESYWSRYASTYDKRRCAETSFKEELDLITSLLDASMSLLEIGAGTGAFTLPLASEVHQVTAVEPSPSMRRILKEKITRAGLANIQIIDEKWTEASIEPADAVLASGCFYVFYDIGAALRKMIDNARRILILTTGDWGYWSPYQEAARVLDTAPPVIGPGFIHLYNVLYQLGICANVASLTRQRELIYDSFEHITEIWAERLELVDEKIPQLKNYIEQRASRTSSGEISLGKVTNVTTVIWHFKNSET